MADDDEPGDGFPDEDYEPEPLDDHELHLVEQDLTDLGDLESAFRPEGFRGVAIWCQDCAEEHYYPWDMLRQNLTSLLETGETPVHEPAFAPEPDRYVPWDYARGYVDALRETGVEDRVELEWCPGCGLELEGPLGAGNFCPRCGATLFVARLRAALEQMGLDEDAVIATLRRAGLTRG